MVTNILKQHAMKCTQGRFGKVGGARLIDAHILLGRIFLEKGDVGEARKYASSAMAIDPDNQEAMALQRQVTMGSKP